MDKRDQNEAEAPERLVAALRAMEKERVFVPAARDEAILGPAKLGIAEVRRGRRRVRLAVQLTALAASIVVVALVVQLAVGPGRAQVAREDLNEDGQVDILDAFQLARALKSGSELPQSADQNSDGRIDSVDVEMIARRSVRVEGAGSL